MKTAEDYIDERVDALQDGEEVSIPQLMREYALLVAKEALKNASIVGNALIENGDLVTEIILNESNIPKL